MNHINDPINTAHISGIQFEWLFCFASFRLIDGCRESWINLHTSYLWLAQHFCFVFWKKLLFWMELSSHSRCNLHVWCVGTQFMVYSLHNTCYVCIETVSVGVKICVNCWCCWTKISIYVDLSRRKNIEKKGNFNSISPT